MKRILLLSGALRLSGSTTWMLNLHKGMLQAGADVVHLVTSDEAEIQPDFGRRLYTGRARSAPLLRAARWLQLHKLLPDWYARREERCMEGRVERILATLGWQDRVDLVIKDFTSRLPAPLARFPVTAVIHEELSVTAGDWLAKAMAQRARHFIPVSGLAGEDAARLGVSVGTAIYNPLDMATIEEKSRAFVSDEKPGYVLYVGKLNRTKGVHELLQAYVRSDLDVALVYVGRGEELESLQAEVRRLGLESKVHFTGFQPNPYPYMKHARLLVLPSASEAMPYVLFEAAALGVPVLAARFKAASEFLDEEVIVDRIPESGFVERLSARLAAAIDGPPSRGIKPGILESMEPVSVARRYLALAEND